MFAILADVIRLTTYQPPLNHTRPDLPLRYLDRAPRDELELLGRQDFPRLRLR